jgi:hypothetical protein
MQQRLAVIITMCLADLADELNRALQENDDHWFGPIMRRDSA